MKRQILADAIGNLDDDILGNYFSFKEKLATKRLNAKRRRMIKAVSSLAACFCVACICVFAVIMNNNNTPPVVDNVGNAPGDGNVSNNSGDDNVGNNSGIGNDSGTGGNSNMNSVVPGLDLPSADEIFWPDSSDNSDGDAVECFKDWNGKKVSDRLYNTLMKAEDDSLLYIIVTASNYDELLRQHVYEGQTYEQREKKVNENLDMIAKMKTLLEFDGENLKHGEKICTEGNEYGEKWDRYYYNLRVEYYGEEFLSKYIVDGVFLREKLKADIERLEEDPQSSMHSFITDFRIYYTNENIHRFDNIDGYAFIYGSIELILTKEAFKNMVVEGMEEFAFRAVVPHSATVDD